MRTFRAPMGTFHRPEDFALPCATDFGAVQRSRIQEGLKPRTFTPGPGSKPAPGKAFREAAVWGFRYPGTGRRPLDA